MVGVVVALDDECCFVSGGEVEHCVGDDEVGSYRHIAETTSTKSAFLLAFIDELGYLARSCAFQSHSR